MPNENQVREVLGQLREFQAINDNLKSTQERCSELLEENRQLKREKARLCGVIEKLLGFTAEEANDETIAWIMEKVKTK